MAKVIKFDIPGLINKMVAPCKVKESADDNKSKEKMDVKDIPLEIPDFLKLPSSNTYRTKHFIVVQLISTARDKNEDNYLYSYDTFFARTKLRDALYFYDEDKDYVSSLNFKGCIISTVLTEAITLYRCIS